MSTNGGEEDEADGKDGHARRKRMMLLSKSGGLREAFERGTVQLLFELLEILPGSGNCRACGKHDVFV